jgi:hypothetical protein
MFKVLSQTLYLTVVRTSNPTNTVLLLGGYFRFLKKMIAFEAAA